MDEEPAEVAECFQEELLMQMKKLNKNLENINESLQELKKKK
jgi:hypothetical protein